MKYLQSISGSEIKTLGYSGNLYYSTIGRIKIPAFSTTRGILPSVSILVGWMDIQASRKFCFPLFQSITWPTTCCLCVAFRMDDRVFRYKLNEGDEVGLFYPEYNGELLMGKIRIEIWTIANQCINPSDIYLNTSIITNLEDPYTTQQYSLEGSGILEYSDFGAAPDFAQTTINPQALDNNIWTLASSSEPISSGIPLI